MARVKRGVQARAKHKKIIKQAKGYRGRSKNVFNRIKEDIKDVSIIEQEPKMLGRQLIMVLSPMN